METTSSASSALVVPHGRENSVNPGCIERRQQILLREGIVVGGAGVVELLGHALQNSQAGTDEKLREVAQYAHDHVLHTAADTEKRLGSRIGKYFEDVQVHFEATNNIQIDSQAAEINKRLVSVVQDVHGRVDTSMKTSLETFASELGQKVNATLTAMEGAINEHKKTHASECELRLDAALKSSHNTFEAATDLQAEWIERRLNAKLKAAVETESKKLQLAQQLYLIKQEKHLQGQAAELAKSHANTVEERLQQKIDSAINVAHLHTLSKLGERFGDMSSTLECDKAALKRELHDDIRSNRIKIEAKFQSQLSDFQTASSRRNSKLKQQIAQLSAAADRLNTRLSSIENQYAQENSFPCNNTNADDLTIKTLHPKTNGWTSPASSAVVDNQASESDSSSQDDRHLPEGCVDTAILTTLNQINLGIEALLRKPQSPTITTSIKHTTNNKVSRIPSRIIKRRSGIPQKTSVPIQRAAGLLSTTREAATKQIQARASKREKELRKRKH